MSAQEKEVVAFIESSIEVVNHRVYLIRDKEDKDILSIGQGIGE